MERFVFLNTTIVTTIGDFSCREASLASVQALLLQNPDTPRLSAVGHESTAQIVSSLLGETVAVNRIQYVQEVGDHAICFKLNGRAPEGVILSAEEIEKIGYSFLYLTRTK
jgi:hypothetical protein